MMSQSIVVQFDSCVVHTTLSHFTNCVNRLELKSSRKLLLQSTRFAAQRNKFTLIGFGFHQVIIDTSSFIFSFNFPTHKENFQSIFYLSMKKLAWMAFIFSIIFFLFGKIYKYTLVWLHNNFAPIL